MAISDQTTNLSNLSIERNLSVGTLQAGASTLSSTLSVGGDVTITGTLAVAGSAAFSKLYTATVSIVTITALVNRSTTTTATVSGLSTVDYVQISPPSSGLSNGLTIDAYCNAADTLTVMFSNVSGAQAVQAGPVNYKILVFR